MVVSHPDAKRLFAELESQRTQIDAAIGIPLTWQNLSDVKSAKVFVKRPGSVENRAEWPSYFNWLRENLATFNEVLRPRILALDVTQAETTV
jgi:hypothetical protein